MKHEVEKIWAKRYKSILRAVNAELKKAGLRGKVKEIAISVPEMNAAALSVNESINIALERGCDCTPGVTKPCFFLDHNGTMSCKCIPINEAC